MTSERTFDVSPDDEVVDPTIDSTTHKIKEAKISQGHEVRIKKRIRLVPGDIVFSRLHTQNGAFAFCDRVFHSTSTFVPFKVRDEIVDRQYLFWALHKFVPMLSTSDTVGRETYKTSDILSLEIPLPSLNEQKRIVARIDNLIRRIEKAKKLSEKGIERSDNLFNATLAKTFDKFVDHYGTKQLDELVISGRYGTSVKCTYDRFQDSIPVLRIPNVISERISLEDLKFCMMDESKYKNLLLSEGDLLVVRTCGSADLVGRCAVIPKLPEAMAFASYLIRLRCNQDLVDPYYLQIMLRHLRTSKKLFDFARTTAGQYNVSLKRLLNAQIPLPPSPVQRRLIDYFHTLQAKIDYLKGSQIKIDKNIGELIPSILDKELKGVLH